MADGLPNQETGEVDNKYMTLRRPAPSVKTSPGSLSSGRLQPIKNGFVWGTVSVWAKKGRSGQDLVNMVLKAGGPKSLSAHLCCHG